VHNPVVSQTTGQKGSIGRSRTFRDGMKLLPIPCSSAYMSSAHCFSPCSEAFAGWLYEMHVLICMSSVTSVTGRRTCLPIAGLGEHTLKGSHYSLKAHFTDLNLHAALSPSEVIHTIKAQNHSRNLFTGQPTT
jgi:hypothetical protein